MKESDVHDLADALMRRYLRPGWGYNLPFKCGFAIEDLDEISPSFLAVTERDLDVFNPSWVKSCRIVISRHLVQLGSYGAIKEALLHEIAHVLSPTSEEHGPNWELLLKLLRLREGMTVDGTVEYDSKEWADEFARHYNDRRFAAA